MEMLLTETFRDIYWKYMIIMVVVQWYVAWKLEKGMVGMWTVEIIFLVLFPIIIPYLMMMQ